MADNSVLNAGVGGDTYASDDIGGIKYQRNKLIHGVDGVNDGDVARTNPLPVSDLPTTTGGGADYHKLAVNSNNAAAIKPAAGQVYGVKVFNVAAYPVYVKLYDKATAPAPGADTVVRTVGVQGGQRADDLIPKGLAFATGIAIAIVKGIGETDNTSVAAGDCVVDVDYK